jgi:hypothetical protein
VITLAGEEFTETGAFSTVWSNAWKAPETISSGGGIPTSPSARHQVRRRQAAWPAPKFK